ncbi:MAG: ornithine carbamoyltransferase [Pirellulales bacterium]|nr:ornithine carbamoyltransferase [Pirellulales bacterium]
MSRPRHFLTLEALGAEGIERVLARAVELSRLRGSADHPKPLAGKSVALVMEKASTRTRVSFEVGIVELGGHPLALAGRDLQIGRGEPIEDTARVLSRYVHAIVHRTFAHATLERLAAFAAVPVVNALSDSHHPCQLLADLAIVRREHGSLGGGLRVAWIGDGNNVARSLAIGCGKVGMRMAMGTPEGYRFEDEFLDDLRRIVPELDLAVAADPAQAVRGAVAVYTDVWTSMGQEAESEQRRRDFAEYQVNAKLMSRAPKDAIFMHCLPAHRGEEVTDEVIDGPQSVVVRQAGNRMHVQKGILAWMLAAQA